MTKAAVYHQFKAKEEIVLAAAEDELARGLDDDTLRSQLLHLARRFLWST